MSLLAVRVGAGVLALLALLTLRGKRWAYPAFVVLGLLYFPAQTHFHVHVPKCEQLLPTMQVLVLSLHNYAYIALFAGVYWIPCVQYATSHAPPPNPPELHPRHPVEAGEQRDVRVV